MNIEDIQFLSSPEGGELLKKYANLGEEALGRLPLKLHKQGVRSAAALVTLLKLRQKARGKFDLAESMFFTPLGLGQATSERIARHIAQRFVGIDKVVDLTAGSGGNAIFLAEHSRVIAIEPDETTLACAKLNAGVYGVEKNIDFVLGKAEENIVIEADAFFLDPARDRSGKTKTRSLLNSRPSVIELLPKLLAITDRVCIKISPAFDYEELKLLPALPEVEIISEEGVNKVALLWFGRFKTCERRATCLNKDDVFTLIDQIEARAPIALKPGVYLYESDKAISKAHLIDELAVKFDLKKLEPHSALLTNDELIKPSACPCRVFRIMTVADFSWQSLANKLKELDVTRVNVIIKHLPLEAEEVYRRLKLKEGSDHFLIFTTLNEKWVFFIAERVFS